MGDISDIYKNLSDIVPSVNKQPTIINPESNFVVVTYWWGAPNQNANIARPCILFYEKEGINYRYHGTGWCLSR